MAANVSQGIRFHILVRGVILSQGSVLLARRPSADWTFLPGGHVEEGEGLEGALKREIQEEIGMRCHVGRYIGAVEGQWRGNGTYNREVNHVFSVELLTLQPKSNVESREKDLEFIWAEVQALKSQKIMPQSILPLILKSARGVGEDLLSNVEGI